MALAVKIPSTNAGDVGSIPGCGRSPGGVNGSPLQYSCLENSTDRGAWWAIVHEVAKSRTRLSTHAHTKNIVNITGPVSNRCQIGKCREEENRTGTSSEPGLMPGPLCSLSMAASSWDSPDESSLRYSIVLLADSPCVWPTACRDLKLTRAPSHPRTP